MEWSGDKSKSNTLKPSIVIVGTGFSGLGLAIRLKMQGIEDFAVLEKATSVGGVWRDNSYPGCACDVESHLYSFSFAPNPNWTRRFSQRAEIWAYLRTTAEKFGIDKHIRFSEELIRAEWIDATRRWSLETSTGNLEARVLISGTGAFSEALIPSFPGLESFRGETFHSSNWNHEFDLRDKRVAVVGTGASAIQFIPKIQPLLKELTIYQRTPAWVLSKADGPISDTERSRLNRFPLLQKAHRLLTYLSREALGNLFRHPKLMGIARFLSLRYLKRSIRDPSLRARLTPTYEIGCKRILLSNDYYPALAQANVSVVSESVESIGERSIKSADGIEREFDAIIWGTGFKVTDFPISHRVFGRDGQSIAEYWQGSASAFLGCAIPNFPNFFTLLGPNTGLGHSSVVLMIEAQIDLLLEAIPFLLQDESRILEANIENQAAFQREIDHASSKTVWVSGGCRSWYLDTQGRNSTLWPRSIGAFRRRILPFDPSDFQNGGERHV